MAHYPVEPQCGTIGGRARNRLSGRAAPNVGRSARVAGAIPGMPAAAAGVGVLSGVVANVGPSELTGGAVAVQAGGADKCPTKAACPTPADIELPAPPSPATLGNPCAPTLYDDASVAKPPRLPELARSLAPTAPSVDAVQAVTIWDGLKAPLDVTVFQKLEFGSRIDATFEPDEPDDEPVAGEDMLCKAVGSEVVACDNVAWVSVVADELVAWVTAAACSVCPSELVVFGGVVNDGSLVAAADSPA